MNTIFDILPAMSLLAFVTAFTPGPNNFLLASSGAQFGVRKSVYHLLGIRLGIIGLLLLCASGVAVALQQHPTWHQILRYLGASYMLWLVVKLVFTSRFDSTSGSATPLTLIQASFFQVGNIKAWMACLALISGYTLPNDYWFSVMVIIVVFTLFGLIANASWAFLGRGISQKLDTSRKKRAFSVSLGLLTLLSILPLLTP